MKCDHCDGKGGGADYFGEWWECSKCEETGKLTPARIKAWDDEIAAIEADVERMIAIDAALDTEYGPAFPPSW